MQFGMCHFAYLAKYAIWLKKSVKTRIFITLRLAPHTFGAVGFCKFKTSKPAMKLSRTV